MEETWTNRTELLIGKEGIEKLKKSKVAIYGIGGVGSFVVEGLTRSGIGEFVLIDNDVVSSSNINRQIHANTNTIGKRKIDVMKQRILEINPEAIVNVYMANEIEEGEESLICEDFSYVVDAVDTVKTKLKVILKAKELNVPIISSMGMGNKIDPTKIEVSEIRKTSVCPLARVIRQELRDRKIKHLKVIYTKEEPRKLTKIVIQENGKKTPGSISFVPSVAGLIISSEVVKDIINK